MAELKMEVILQAFDKVTGPLRGIAGQLSRTKTAISKYKKDIRELNKGIPAMGPLSKQQMRDQRELERTNRLLTQQQARLKNLYKIQGHRNSGKALMRQGGIHLAAATAMGYGASRFLGEGMKFDTTMSRVQSLARLEKNSPQMQAMRDQAKYLNQTTWANAQQVAEGQAFYAMAGFSPDAIMKSMPGTLNLAKASGLEIGRAADIGSNILQAFGLEPEEMGRAVDTLVATFTRANVDMEMLGESMKYAAPLAKTLGISMEESATMAGMLGNVGIQGGQAGRAMKQIYARLADATPAGKKALKQLGVKTTDDKGNLREVPELLTEIFEKTKGMGNAKRLGILKSIAGDIAAPAFASLMDETTLENFKKMYEDVKKAHANNEAYHVVKKMEDNLEGDLIYLKAAWSDFQLSIFETNNSGLRSTIQWLTKIMNKVGELAKMNPEVIRNLSYITGGIIGITTALGLAKLAWGTFQFAILGNPLSATLAVIAVSLYAIYKNFDQWVWFFSEGINNVTQDLSKLNNWIGTLIGSIPGIGSELELIWDIAGKFVIGFFNGISVIIKALGFIVDLIFDFDNTVLKIQGHWDDLCMNVKRFWNDIVTWAQPAIDKVMAIIQPFLNAYYAIVGKKSTEMYDQLDIKAKTGLTPDEFNSLNGDLQVLAVGGREALPADDPRNMEFQDQLKQMMGNKAYNERFPNQTNSFQIHITANGNDPSALAKATAEAVQKGIDAVTKSSAFLGDPA